MVCNKVQCWKLPKQRHEEQAIVETTNDLDLYSLCPGPEERQQGMKNGQTHS